MQPGDPTGPRAGPGLRGLARNPRARADPSAQDGALRPAPPRSRESAVSRLAVRGRGRRGGRSERRRRRRRADWAVEVRVRFRVDAGGPAGMGRGRGGLGAVGRGGPEARGRSLRWRLGAAPSGPRPRARPRAPRRPVPCCPPEPGPGPSPSSPPHPRAPPPGFLADQQQLDVAGVHEGRGAPRRSGGRLSRDCPGVQGVPFPRVPRFRCHLYCPPPRSPVARGVVVAAPRHPAGARRAGLAFLPGASWEKARPVATSAGAVVPLARELSGGW